MIKNIYTYLQCPLENKPQVDVKQLLARMRYMQAINKILKASKKSDAALRSLTTLKYTFASLMIQGGSFKMTSKFDPPI